MVQKFVPNVTPAGGASAPVWQDIAGDGAITVRHGVVFLNKSTAGAITLALPLASVNGAELHIVSTTAQAHVVTTPALGVNATNNTLTFGTAVGNSCRLRARNGTWWLTESRNVTASTV